MQPARLAELALKYRLPTMFGARENVEAGGLMGYGADRNDLVRLAPLSTSIRSSRVPSLPSSPWSRRPNTNWSSI